MTHIHYSTVILPAGSPLLRMMPQIDPLGMKLMQPPKAARGHATLMAEITVTKFLLQDICNTLIA